MKTSEAKIQIIVAFERLAGKYDDLFSRSRIGTQRGIVWEVLADTFCPGDEILAFNCRTREDAQFLSLLDVSVVAWNMPEGMIHTGPCPPIHCSSPDAASVEVSPRRIIRRSIVELLRTELCCRLQSDRSCLGTDGNGGRARYHLSIHSILPFRNALVSPPWQCSQGIPQILWDRYRESRRLRDENTLPALEGSEEVVFTIFSHALLHGNRYSSSASVPGADLPQISPNARPTAPNR